MAGYAIVKRQDAPDFMAQYPGFGEMRFFADALGTQQVAFTWRLMPPGAGGKGSYGHRHRTQEEVYFVTRGKLLFKLGDDVVEVDSHTAVRVSPEVFRSVHNDGPDDAELVICSLRSADAENELETTPDFWPEE
jgi:mannose-6-phosphate isomerase-like protein (cupin superfamily)